MTTTQNVQHDVALELNPAETAVDRMGFRGKLGLVVPSRNTVCETEFHDGAPVGVTVHTARIMRPPLAVWKDEAAQRAMVAGLLAGEPAAIAEVATSKPDILIVGDGARSGLEPEHEAQAQLYEDEYGVPAVTAARAYKAAVDALGVRRIGWLSPLRLPATGVPRDRWGAWGCDIVAVCALDCETTFDIVNISEARYRQAFADLASTPVDAIFATGSNFALLRLADRIERWLGITILHINTVLLWYSLRRLGVEDRLPDAGRLVREF